MKKQSKYFIFNGREFGRASIKGVSEDKMEDFTKWLRYPQWCEVSWFRYTVHPIYHWYVTHFVMPSA